MASRALIRHTLTCRLGALTLVAQTVAVGVPSSEPPFNSALGTTRWTLAFVRKPPPLASLLRLMTHPSPASRPRPTLSTRPSARSRPSRSPPSRSSGSSGSRSTVPGTGSRRRAARCSTLRRRSSLSARGKTSSSSSKKGRGRARKGPLENGALPAGVARARGDIGHDLFSKTRLAPYDDDDDDDAAASRVSVSQTSTSRARRRAIIDSLSVVGPSGVSTR
jgi:hypothetical protein